VIAAALLLLPLPTLPSLEPGAPSDLLLPSVLPLPFSRLSLCCHLLTGTLLLLLPSLLFFRLPTFPALLAASTSAVAAAMSSVDKLEKLRGMVMGVMKDKEELLD
jgi:hypothetical protein